MVRLSRAGKPGFFRQMNAKAGHQGGREQTTPLF